MVQSVLKVLKQGKVAAMATDTVFGLIANAADENAVSQLYALKQRPHEQPLQILVKDITQARSLADFSPQAAALTRHFWPGPLTLIMPRKESAHHLAFACGNQPSIGLRMPNTPEILDLITTLGTPLAASSANHRGEAPLQSAEEIEQAFPTICVQKGKSGNLASTVVDCTQQSLHIIREGTITLRMMEEKLI